MKPVLAKGVVAAEAGKRQTLEIQKCSFLAYPFHPVVTDSVLFLPMSLPRVRAAVPWKGTETEQQRNCFTSNLYQKGDRV